MLQQYDIDLYGTAGLMLVALVAFGCAVRALRRRRYGFGGVLLGGWRKWLFFPLAAYLAYDDLSYDVRKLVRYRDYAENGVLTEGLVCQVMEKQEAGFAGRNHAVYLLRIRYRDEHQRPYDAVYRTQYRRNVGDGFPVYYLPLQPQKAYVMGYRESPRHLTAGILAGGSWALMAFSALTAILLRKRKA